MAECNIAEKVWGHVAVEDFQFVRVTMANLRRKIEHDTADARYILTETGVGYRFRA
ncbi:MAG: winged helix-turn-helix domain-containing protein [Treponema sp.]|nr:winged helix-turn-helix domain-containing protein [Treponema sp.]